MNLRESTVKSYHHTQTSYVIITVVKVCMIIIAIVLGVTGINWIAIPVLIILATTGILFSSLTVIIWENDLEIRFGPGLIRKKFRLQDIESVKAVRNRWFYGWGIRLTPHGWLYNVSGYSAVEIKLKTGVKYRIGTDVPQELEEAIRQAI
jgi:hypothetical protein